MASGQSNWHPFTLTGGRWDTDVGKEERKLCGCDSFHKEKAIISLQHFVTFRLYTINSYRPAFPPSPSLTRVDHWRLTSCPCMVASCCRTRMWGVGWSGPWKAQQGQSLLFSLLFPIGSPEGFEEGDKIKSSKTYLWLMVENLERRSCFGKHTPTATRVNMHHTSLIEGPVLFTTVNPVLNRQPNTW